MPESSLSLGLVELAQSVGYYLGYGRLPSSWSGWDASHEYVPLTQDSQLGNIIAVVRGGLRQFYRPAPAGEQAPVHRWSFLTLERTVTTAQGQTDYTLPDDHDEMAGEMSYATTAGANWALRRAGIDAVRRTLAMAGTLQAKPTYYAQVAKAFSGASGQRFTLALYPTPDAAYVLTYRAHVHPPALTAAAPYPAGGMQHGETILASCLAVAEGRFHDEQGVQRAAYQDRLLASIAADARDHQAELGGFNFDRADLPSPPAAVARPARNQKTVGGALAG